MGVIFLTQENKYILQMRKLFLDDCRDLSEAYDVTKFPVYTDEKDWVIVRSFNEFVKYINENGLPDIISYDHDLADEHYKYACADVIPYDNFKEKTGYEAAKWLCEYCQDHKELLPEIFIHTQNTVGGYNIYYYLQNYKKHIEKTIN